MVGRTLAEGHEEGVTKRQGWLAFSYSIDTKGHEVHCARRLIAAWGRQTLCTR